MAKKDVDAPLENIERGNETPPGNISNDHPEKEADQKENKTEVKNAHASGLGSIGRNDHRLDDIKPDFDNY
jgi:hypothetical protein